MPTPPRPTDVDLKLLRALWELGSGTVEDVQAVLNRTEDYGYTGVLRMLQVMFEKGLVARDVSERSHVYRPVHSRASMEKGLVSDLAERLFGGSAAELAMTALKSGKVSAQEKAAIRAMLEGEGRSHTTVFQVQADPDLLGSGRSARQDFSLRLE